MIRISEMFMRMCRIEDLANKELTSVPHVGAWTRIGPWYPWMLMGQQEGQLFFRAYLTRFASLDEVPSAFLQKAEKKHSAYLEIPSTDTWDQPNDTTFNMYRRERKPLPVK